MIIYLVFYVCLLTTAILVAGSKRLRIWATALGLLPVGFFWIWITNQEKIFLKIFIGLSVAAYIFFITVIGNWGFRFIMNLPVAKAPEKKESK